MQGCIKLIKSDSTDLLIQKKISFKQMLFSLYSSNNHVPTKIKQYSCFNINKKCF